MRSRIEHALGLSMHLGVPMWRHDGGERDLAGVGQRNRDVRRIDHGDRHALGRQRIAGLLDGGLRQVPAVVDVAGDGELVQDIEGAADVIGVRVGDPQKVDRGVAQIAGEPGHHPAVPLLARRTALGARRRLAGVDQDVLAVGQCNERGKRLARVVNATRIAGPPHAGAAGSAGGGGEVRREAPPRPAAQSAAAARWAWAA